MNHFIFLLLSYCLLTPKLVYGQEKFVYGLSVKTEDGLSIKVNFGKGKLMEVILPDCRECSIVEISIGTMLDGLVVEDSKPIIRGVSSWIKDDNIICYQIQKKIIRIDNETLFVPKTKQFGCK